MKIAVHLAVVLSFLVLLGACNVFDALYPDDGSSNFERALANAEAAIKRNDFAEAVKLYDKALVLKPTSSVAMMGIASAIIMNDVVLMDIPLLMNSIFNIDVSAEGAASSFLTNLEGVTPDVPLEVYKEKIIRALGKACYRRAPINSIDPVTGEMVLDPVSGMPVDNPNTSDGVIAATNCNSILNYIICKTIEAAFITQEHFVVAKNLAASIDTDALTTYDRHSVFPGIGEIDPLTYDENIYKEQFIAFHIDFTNKCTVLHSAYVKLGSLFLDTKTNTSLLNLAGVANGLVAILVNPDSGMNASTVQTARDSVDRINHGLDRLTKSFNDAGSKILSGFALLEDFRESIEQFGRDEITENGITLKHSWYPYTLAP
ncbi:MAG: tetratricopeptide repeat protein [Spirochaetota bacterium]|nr:tetratricopeptide repeat protein [Spirochaetota bacterium]